MAWHGSALGFWASFLGLLYDTTPRSDPREKDWTGTQHNTLHTVIAEGFIGLSYFYCIWSSSFFVALTVYQITMRASP